MDVEMVGKERVGVADDDGRVRTGTVWTATTHAITAIIGSGVLALPWSVAQLGWIIGPIALVACAYVTYYTSILLSDCYRTPDPVHGKRNYTYMDVVRSILGPRDVICCGVAQYSILWGAMIGYTITTATSIMTVVRSDCYRRHGSSASCSGGSGTWYIIIFGIVEIILSQFPSLEKITLISVVAAVMSFTYSSVSLLLSILKLATAAAGAPHGAASPPATNPWHSIQALGNIAFAYTYSMLLIEIQDTLKSPPPETATMKKASLYGIGVTTVFYVSLGCVGYAAFGAAAPGNVLTGFTSPSWLVAVANVAVVIHLVGAYQVYGQPVFAKYESFLAGRWSGRVYTVAGVEIAMSRVVLRTAFVAATTLVATLLPFFNAVLGLLGAAAFWPLTVYFPVTMYMKQKRIEKGTAKWVALQALSAAALAVSVLAAVGSVADMAERLKHVTIFKVEL